jgi:hypothetical protein
VRIMAFLKPLLLSCCMVASSPAQATRGKAMTLDGIIPRFELTRGSEAIGGAAVGDAVVALRQLVDYPISLEGKEFTAERDGLNLGEAIDQLRALKGRQTLGPDDAARLRAYEQLASTQSRSTLIGFRMKAFSIVESNITVRGVLDRITELDHTYIWTNDGTADSPIIVLRPRETSALDWSVPPICGDASESTSLNLYRPTGKLTELFHSHSISRVYLSGVDNLPNVGLNLCSEHLTARDVLNRTVAAAGNGLSWTLSGKKGLRFISFQ